MAELEDKLLKEFEEQKKKEKDYLLNKFDEDYKKDKENLMKDVEMIKKLQSLTFNPPNFENFEKNKEKRLKENEEYEKEVRDLAKIKNDRHYIFDIIN